MSHKAAKVDCSLLLIDLYKWNTRIPECSSIIHAFINMEIHSRASPRNAALGGSDISGDLRSSSASWAWSRDMNTLLCTDSLLVGLTIGGSTVSPRNGHTQTLVWTLGVRWSRATTLDSGRPRICPWCPDTGMSAGSVLPLNSLEWYVLLSPEVSTARTLDGVLRGVGWVFCEIFSSHSPAVRS